MTINGVDWSILFIILPWVFTIIAAGVAVNFLEKLQVAVEEKAKEIKLERTVQKMKSNEVSQKEKLQQKNMVYVTISVIFSKFTISNLSDREILLDLAEKVGLEKQEVNDMLDSKDCIDELL